MICKSVGKYEIWCVDYCIDLIWIEFYQHFIWFASKQMAIWFALRLNNLIWTQLSWRLHNKLTINHRKTAYIIFENSQNQYQFADNFIFIDKTVIDQVFTMKFLGVFIDTYSNWSYRISKLIGSMRPIVGLFFRLSNHIPRKVLTVLYYSLIHSKIS